MYPQLINQASRLAPMLSRMFSRGGTFATPLWKASQIDTPSVDAQPMPPRDRTGAWAPNAPSVPISDAQAAPAPAATAPTQPMPPVQGLDLPWMPPLPRARPPEAPTAQSVPMPQARPAEAPQAPQDTSFFMRNALMMQDPNGGGFIDPAGAASVTGPDLIQKMMGYLHNKV